MQNQKTPWRRSCAILLPILGAAWIWTCHLHAEAADEPKRGSACFSRLEGTKAITPHHHVRVSLRGFTRDSNIPDSRNAVIDVEPSLLDPAFFECKPKLSPSGAIQAKGVFLSLRDTPAPNGDPVGIGISAMAH